MPIYSCTAMDGSGRECRERVEAETEKDAAFQLKDKGLPTVSVKLRKN